MNEVFEMVAEVLEELRSEAGEREYSVCTKEAKNAAKELKKANQEYEKLLAEISGEQRELLEKYMDIVDHAHFQEEQRAYYQGMIDIVDEVKDVCSYVSDNTCGDGSSFVPQKSRQLYPH